MQGKATFRHHPIHPMLVSFPQAFWIGSGGADALFTATKDPFWRRAADTLIDFGLLTGAASAVVGLVDYLTIAMPPPARRTATLHLLTNLGLLGLYAVNHGLRAADSEDGRLTGYALSAVGLAAVTYSGWLGGTLSFEHHVGVEEPARGEE